MSGQFILKAFKPFELLRQPMDSHEAALEQFDKLVLGGEYDAVYVQDEEGRLAAWWDEDYDQPEGGTLEPMGYLKKLGGLELRLLGPEHAKPTEMGWNDTADFMAYDPDTGEHAALMGGISFECTERLGQSIVGALNIMRVMARACDAAGQALDAADPDFARQVLIDAAKYARTWMT